MTYRIELHNKGGLLTSVTCELESQTTQTMNKLVKSLGVLNHGDKFIVIDENIENEDKNGE